MDPRQDEFPEFVDSAHENLRSVRFPFSTPDHVVAQFFARCSDELKVVELMPHDLTQATLETFATKCIGLRTLNLDIPDLVDWNGLVTFMELRGPDLVCLSLSYDPRAMDIFDRRVIQAITTHCRSLEVFSLCSDCKDLSTDFEEDFLELVPRIGPGLKSLGLLSIPFSRLTDGLMLCIAYFCPNLEELTMPLTLGVRPSPPTHEQAEHNHLHQPPSGLQQSMSVTDAMSGSNVQEGTFWRLMKQCTKLQSLFMMPEFDWSGFSDSELKAKVECIATECEDLIIERKYFDHTFYASQ